jgi:NAD(P)-dependent dehydrogenase (short-subunit alcohol dehydrogenase family)
MLYSVIAMRIDRRQFLGYAGASLTSTQLLGCGRDRVATPGIPESSFHEGSTAADVTAGLDLTGKTVVVTGCTSGIGFETMRVLASRGAYVIGSSRSIKRATDACKSFAGVTSPVELDLGDFDSVVNCAEQIRAMRRPIDMLICNAGYFGGGKERQLINGVEKHFAINHLGHFILVNRLLDRMFIANQGRVVVVSSRTAYSEAPSEGIVFDDLIFDDGYTDFRAYGHSKLANALFSLGLSRHFSGILQFGFKLLAATRGKTVAEGAATSCYVATNESLGAVSGAYFEDCNAVTILGENHLYDLPMAERLMQVSQEMTADYLVEQKLPSKDNPFNDPVKIE